MALQHDRRCLNSAGLNYCIPGWLPRRPSCVSEASRGTYVAFCLHFHINPKRHRMLLLLHLDKIKRRQWLRLDGEAFARPTDVIRDLQKLCKSSDMTYFHVFCNIYFPASHDNVAAKGNG